MTRNKLANLTDIPGRTIRYYEEKGIIPVPDRTANGYRNYNESLVTRLKFIKNAQKLGFSLGEIKELARIKDALNRFTQYCSPNKGIEECELLSIFMVHHILALNQL